jgi:hypothetical protein
MIMGDSGAAPHDSGAPPPLPDSGASPPPGDARDSAPSDGAPSGVQCDPVGAASIYVAQGPMVWRYSPATGSTVPFVPPACPGLLTNIQSVAVDTDGQVWLLDASGMVLSIDPRLSPPSCDVQLLKFANSLGPAVIGFVPPQGPSSATLFAYQGGTLQLFVAGLGPGTTVGPMNGASLTGLSGTADGLLYAVYGSAAPNEVMVALVSTSDASLGTTIATKLPTAMAFSGGAYWGGDFYLFAQQPAYPQQSLYVLQLATGTVSAPTMLPIPSAAVVVGSAPCPSP